MGKYSGYCEERERRGNPPITEAVIPAQSVIPAQAGIQWKGGRPPGFSLVELAIVMVVLSIVAVAAVPMLGSALHEVRLSGAADEVVTALEYAQLSAMTSGRTTRVVIGATQEKIAVEQYETAADLFGGGGSLAEGVVEGGTYEFMQYPLKRGSDYEILLKSEDRFAGVDITASDFDNATPVTFDALGSPSHGGTATLSLGSRQMVVTLDALTGKVTVSD
jgi:prepilin-type N-terminal cleavage/methylation domain-containing protein